MTVAYPKARRASVFSVSHSSKKDVRAIRMGTAQGLQEFTNILVPHSSHRFNSIYLKCASMMMVINEAYTVLVDVPSGLLHMSPQGPCDAVSDHLVFQPAFFMGTFRRHVSDSCATAWIFGKPTGSGSLAWVLVVAIT